jgi:hypothetical protein
MSREQDTYELFGILSHLRMSWTKIVSELGMNFVG